MKIAEFIGMILVAAGLFLAVTFIQAWVLMVVWNFIAVQVSFPVINIWIAWAICFVISSFMPKSSK